MAEAKSPKKAVAGSTPVKNKVTSPAPPPAASADKCKNKSQKEAGKVSSKTPETVRPSPSASKAAKKISDGDSNPKPSEGDFAMYVTRTLMKELSKETVEAKPVARTSKKAPKAKTGNEAATKAKKAPAAAAAAKEAKVPEKVKKSGPSPVKKDPETNGDEPAVVPDIQDFASYVTRRLVKNLSGPDLPSAGSRTGTGTKKGSNMSKSVSESNLKKVKSKKSVEVEDPVVEKKVKAKKSATTMKDKVARIVKKKQGSSASSAGSSSNSSSGSDSDDDDDNAKSGKARPVPEKPPQANKLDPSSRFEISSDSDTDKYSLKRMTKKVNKKRKESFDSDNPEARALKKPPTHPKQKLTPKPAAAEPDNRFLESHSSDENLPDKDAKTKMKKGRRSFADKKKYSKFNTFKTIDERFDSLFGQDIRTKSGESKQVRKFEKYSSESSEEDPLDDFDDINDDEALRMPEDAGVVATGATPQTSTKKGDDLVKSDADGDADLSDAPLKKKKATASKKLKKVQTKKTEKLVAVARDDSDADSESDDDDAMLKPSKKKAVKSRPAKKATKDTIDSSNDKSGKKGTPSRPSKSAKTAPEVTTTSTTATTSTTSTPVGDFANYVTRTLLKSIDTTPTPTWTATKVASTKASSSKVAPKSDEKVKKKNVTHVTQSKTDATRKIASEEIKTEPKSTKDSSGKKRKSFNFDDDDDDVNVDVDANDAKSASKQNDFASYVTRTLVKTICSPDDAGKQEKKGGIISTLIETARRLGPIF